MPTLVLDERERNWHLRLEVYGKIKFPEWDLEVRTLEVGDYAYSDLLGIEHKSPGDFLSSLQSGRLFNQAHEISQAYQQAFVVVDGNPQDLWRNKFVRYPAENIHGVLASLAVRRKTPVLFTGSNEVDFMTTIFKLASKTRGDGSFVYNPVRSKGSKRELARHLIAALPGVGPKRAETILQAYRTPLEALTDYKNWSALHGIVNSTADKAGQVLEAEPESPPHREDEAEEPVTDLRTLGSRGQAGELRPELQRRKGGNATSAFLRAGRKRQNVDGPLSGP